jgi:hypothetical protein
MKNFWSKLKKPVLVQTPMEDVNGKRILTISDYVTSYLDL